MPSLVPLFHCGVMVAANEDCFHYVDKYIFGSMEDLSLRSSVMITTKAKGELEVRGLHWCDISVGVLG